ncbi:Tr-type G domain-containing protein [Psidium guajava]|nr:Tr-type G domain-containing protein [Psidium guajava]
MTESPGSYGNREGQDRIWSTPNLGLNELQWSRLRATTKGVARKGADCSMEWGHQSLISRVNKEPHGHGGGTHLWAVASQEGRGKELAAGPDMQPWQRQLVPGKGRQGQTDRAEQCQRRLRMRIGITCELGSSIVGP